MALKDFKFNVESIPMEDDGINLEELKPSFEEVDEVTEEINSNQLIQNKKKIYFYR